MTDFKKYVLGWKKDPHDSRDYRIRRFLAEIGLPRKLDLRDKLSPVRNQGYAGSCVGFASAMMEDWQERTEYNQDLVTSPRFIYSECKKIDGIPNEEGTYIRVAMKILKDKGVCLEKSCLYSSYNAKKECPSSSFEEALKYKDESYARIITISEMKQALNQLGPFVIGIPIFDSFYLTGRNGIVPIPKSGENLLGGHALCVCGYDDDEGLLTFRNSWGTIWGEKGDGYLPYEYLTVIGIGAYDAWKSVDITTSPEPPDPNDDVISVRLQVKELEGEWVTVWERTF